MDDNNSNKNVHLVLSSGVVKCFSYLGAINRLLHNGNKIASISACTIGTLISGTYD